MAQLIGAAAAAAGAGFGVVFLPRCFRPFSFLFFLDPCVLRGACTVRRVTLTGMLGMLSPLRSRLYLWLGRSGLSAVSKEATDVEWVYVSSGRGGQRQPIADVAVAVAVAACMHTWMHCMHVCNCSILVWLWLLFCASVAWGWVSWDGMDGYACLLAEMLRLLLLLLLDLSMGISWRV